MECPFPVSCREGGVGSAKMASAETCLHGPVISTYPNLFHFFPLFLFPSFTFREVQKAVNTAQGLFQRWTELLQDPCATTREEIDWTTNELRNNLRSIEWDLEDLDETINILWGLKINGYLSLDYIPPSKS